MSEGMKSFPAVLSEMPLQNGTKSRSRSRVYLIVNFGGPRDLSEVEEFLIALLTDQEVIQSALPGLIHRLFFSWVAKRRAKRVSHDYAAIGGKSPIFEDTEALAAQLRETLQAPVMTFHRYIPKTHLDFLKQMNALENVDEIWVFPLFPQFSYTTTGSIALWFQDHLPKKVINKMHWIKSYPDDPLYLKAFAHVIAECLNVNDYLEEDTVLLFSAHGLPQRYINNGDVYERECKLTAQKLSAHFPKALSHLCYQSQFGKELWLKPSTIETCNASEQWAGKYKNAVVIPLSFTSDHIETLHEVEKEYLPVLREKGLRAVRCPALNLRSDWVEAIASMLRQEHSLGNGMLVRH